MKLPLTLNSADEKKRQTLEFTLLLQARGKEVEANVTQREETERKQEKETLDQTRCSGATRLMLLFLLQMTFFFTLHF